MLSEKPWRPDSVLRFFLGLFTSIFLGMLMLKWLNSNQEIPGPEFKVVALVVGTVSFHGMALLLVSIFLREHELNWSQGFGFTSRRLGRAILLAVVVGIAVVPIAWTLGRLSAQIMTWFHFTPAVQETVQTLQEAPTLDLKILIGLFTVFVAPLAEELVFRGVLYPAVKQLGYPRLAFWGTSILFAAIHNNAVIFLPLFFLAVILTLLYETTDNLLAPVIAHGVFNLANFYRLLTHHPVPLPPDVAP